MFLPFSDEYTQHLLKHSIVSKQLVKTVVNM